MLKDTQKVKKLVLALALWVQLQSSSFKYMYKMTNNKSNLLIKTEATRITSYAMTMFIFPEGLSIGEAL